ncbi:MAG: hypothetical protein WCV41_04775, partial [Patescibacteria group bacterium]
MRSIMPRKYFFIFCFLACLPAIILIANRVDSATPRQRAIPLVSPSPAPFMSPADALQKARAEADWVVSCQRASGALTLNPGGVNINPYFANLAIMPLSELGADYRLAVKKYIQWYLAKYNRAPDNLGVVGTIYDYAVTDQGETPKYLVDSESKNYDSSDSYAATFLSVARAYQKNYGDREWIKQITPDLKIIAGAIEATRQANGLTFAKLNYDTQYLMDNTEVWRGGED